MPKGPSGRVVIEMDPDLKAELYEALEHENLNLKQWFLLNVEEFLKDRGQMSLSLNTEEGQLPEVGAQ